MTVDIKNIAGYILIRRMMKHVDGSAWGLLLSVKDDVVYEMTSAELTAAIDLNIGLDLDNEDTLSDL